MVKVLRKFQRSGTGQGDGAESSDLLKLISEIPSLSPASDNAWPLPKSVQKDTLETLGIMQIPADDLAPLFIEWA